MGVGVGLGVGVAVVDVGVGSTVVLGSGVGLCVEGVPLVVPDGVGDDFGVGPPVGVGDGVSPKAGAEINSRVVDRAIAANRELSLRDTGLRLRDRGPGCLDDEFSGDAPRRAVENNLVAEKAGPLRNRAGGEGLVPSDARIDEVEPVGSQQVADVDQSALVNDDGR